MLGALESRMVEVVGEWSRRRDPSIQVRNTTFIRSFRHCFVAKDLVYIALNGKWNNPGSRLVKQTIGPDADRQGIGHAKGQLFKRFKLSPEDAQRLQADYDTPSDITEQFTAAHPEIATDLYDQIEKAVKNRIDTD